MQVYILHGEDKFNIQRRVQQIKQTIDEQWLEFNYCQVPENATLIEVMNELRTSPLGGNSRIVHVVNDCLFKDIDIAKKAVSNLDSIPTSNILLVTPSKKPATNTVVIKQLLKHGKMEEFPLISEWKFNSIAAYIKTEAANKGLQLDGTIIEYLADNMGNDTELIDSELNKVALYAKSSTITIEVLQNLIGNSQNNSIELANLCLNGNSQLAVSKLEQLRHIYPLQIAATLSSCFRTWLAVKAGMIEGLDDTVIAVIGGIHNPRRIYYLKENIRNQSLKRLQNISSILVKLEYELKTSNDTLLSRVIEITQS